MWVVQSHWSAGAGSKRIDTKPAYVIRTVHADVQRCIVELQRLICPRAVSSAALNSMHNPRSLPGVAHTRRATSISHCGRTTLIRDDDETHISSRHMYHDGLDVVSSLMQRYMARQKPECCVQPDVYPHCRFSETNSVGGADSLVCRRGIEADRHKTSVCHPDGTCRRPAMYSRAPLADLPARCVISCPQFNAQSTVTTRCRAHAKSNEHIAVRKARADQG